MTGPAKPVPAPDFQALFQSLPGLYLVLSPDFLIVAASDAYLKATRSERDAILGCSIFEVFPDNPDNPDASGTQNLRASLNHVRQNRVADAMPFQRFDIPRPAARGGGFEARCWSAFNSPVLGPGGEVLYIVHDVVDVTEFMRLHEQDPETPPDLLRAQSDHAKAEIYNRETQLCEANRRRLDSLSRLVGGVAHDFNNFLGVILNCTELLEEQIGNPELTRRLLGQMKQAADKATALTRQLHDYSSQHALLDGAGATAEEKSDKP
jgi:signal transduction histidine kinase